MLRAGELRHRLELQEKQPGPSRDEYGQPVATWVTRGVCFAKFEQLTANEQVVAQQQNSQATQAIVTRYMRSVQPTTAWRIKFGQRRLFIASIDNVNELNEEWRIICGELKDV